MAGLDFSVRVGKPELVRPETPTPHQFKCLSNIDDQAGLRNHIPFVHFYPRNPGSVQQDPVPVVRRALSRVLVHYCPLAGRLRHGEKGKLVVDCCGEGVIFREADADVTLQQLRRAEGGLRSPFPQWERLLVDDVWGCHLVTDSPLLRMQVTRLACGGFVLAYTINHCACNACGALQFVTALAEFARDPSLLSPSLLPAWARGTFCSRSPPRPTHPHPEYSRSSSPSHSSSAFRALAQLSVFFSRADVSALKRQLAGPRTPTFDAVAACLWRARARALSLDGSTHLLFPIDTRLRHRPLLPRGYYGTAVVFPCANVPADELRRKPLRYAAEKISAVKKLASDDEYRQSVLDFIEENERRGFVRRAEAFVVSDMSRLRFADVDLGWGPAVYGGPARAGTGAEPGMVTTMVEHRREDGVEGLLALASLPRGAVEAFQREVREQIEIGEGMEGSATAVGLSAL